MESKFSYYLPPAGIHFLVSGLLDEEEGQIGFQSVSGLSAEMVTESYREGGQYYEYNLPVKVQYSNLILKRGFWTPSAGSKDRKDLKHWFNETISSLKVQSHRDITIQLMNASRDSPIMSWQVLKAWPKKWTISDFNAEENQLVIETLEFHYAEFKLI